jgi:hypothetical protein
MNSRQERKLSMCLAVQDYLAQNSSTVSSLPDFSVYTTALQDAILFIQTYSEQQMFMKNGHSTGKQRFKTRLVSLAADTARKLQAFARISSNPDLSDETRFSESDLRMATDHELHDKARGIHERAGASLPAIKAFGITEESQAALLKAITDFAASIPSTRLAITEKKQGTMQISKGFEDADQALDTIESLIEIIRVSEPNFYAGYKSVRKLVLTGRTYLSVKGSVREEASGEPVPGALLSFKKKENGSGLTKVTTGPVLTKKTALKGGYAIKSLPAGLYTVTISKNGFEAQNASIAVSDGEMTTLDIRLIRN